MNKTNNRDEEVASYLPIRKGNKWINKNLKVAALQYRGKEKSSKQDKTDLIRNRSQAVFQGGRWVERMGELQRRSDELENPKKTKGNWIKTTVCLQK